MPDLDDLRRWLHPREFRIEADPHPRDLAATLAAEAAEAARAVPPFGAAAPEAYGLAIETCASFLANLSTNFRVLRGSGSASRGGRP